jgi:hypothetical protein
VSNVFVGYRREPESAAPLSCVSSASGSWTGQVSSFSVRHKCASVGVLVDENVDPIDRFPIMKNRPAGWFCTPTDARPDHTCACKRMDADKMWEGTPQEGPESKVWCHKEHSLGVQWHLWLARVSDRRRHPLDVPGAHVTESGRRPEHPSRADTEPARAAANGCRRHRRATGQTRS